MELSDDQRRIQTKYLWDRGFGRDPSVNAENFEAYLAGIPQIRISRNSCGATKQKEIS